MKHTMDELRQWQALPLSIKVRMTETRIRAWVDAYGIDGVYVSFSGGKDSTVLLDIARKMYPDMVAVFVDTGLEYPEIRNFVKTFENVTWIKPELTFKQVIQKYGYPFITKEVAECVEGARKYLTSILAEESLDKQASKQASTRTTISMTSYADLENTEKLEALAQILNERMVNKTGGNNQRLAIMLGMLTKDKANPIKANIPDEEISTFSQVRYKFFLTAPFEISNKCCKVIKKNPSHKYNKESGRHPMTAQMASESKLRTQKWLQNGCNGFDLREPISNPMAFWTEQDVLLYLKQNNIPLCSIYGEIVEDTDGTNEVAGQMTFSDLTGWEDMELFDAERLPLKTTGCARTGCMFCGFGCHLNNDQRFVQMKQTHPKQYDYIMRPESEGGLNYKEIIDWINENGNLNIKY